MAVDDITARTRAAHGDAWQEQGLLRRPFGGDAAELAGVRLMTSGIAAPQWNNADVHDPEAVDVDEVRAWYAGFGVPWGVRVPSGAPWSHGRHLFAKRLMGLPSGELRPAPSVAGLDVRAATRDDVAVVLDLDVTVFGGEPALSRRWLEPHLRAASTEVALALLGAEPVGTAYCLRSDGWAGPASYLAGVLVVPDARGRGIAAAMSWWLLARSFDRGSRFAHLHPDDDRAARVYSRLGFAECGGLDVYVDL